MEPNYDQPVAPGVSRIWSTVVQVFISGGFVVLTDAIATDIPANFQAYWTAALTLLLTVAMAWADEQHIPYPGQKALGRVKTGE